MGVQNGIPFWRIPDIYSAAEWMGIDYLHVQGQAVDSMWFDAEGKRQGHAITFLYPSPKFGTPEGLRRAVRDIHARGGRAEETLFVVDAMQGQDAVNTARAFAEALPLTGVVLTKLDGDARGGAALSVRHVTGQPIKFAGVSEKPDGLEPFHPERMASRVLGMGDVLSLIEEAQRGVDQVEAEKLAKKIKSGKSFDLEDFKTQLQQMQKMGGVGALLDKLPGQASQGAVDAAAGDKAMRRIEGIINAMTPAERRKPEILKASRKRRIAAGAGVQVQEVNRLLNQFEQTQKMMKSLAKGGMGKMMRAMKGMMPGMG
jgi:signal recognition particle subunit SRP54